MPAVTIVTPLGHPTVLPAPGEPGFLLESAAVPSTPGSPPCGGRWTLWGNQPAALLTGKHQSGAFHMTLTTWREPDGIRLQHPRTTNWRADPFVALRQLQNTYAAQPPPGVILPPFCGGLVGTFGYETAHAVENLPGRLSDEQDLPDLAFLVVDDLIAHDRDTDHTFLVATGRGTTDQAARQDAELRLDALKEEVLSFPGPRDGSVTGMAKEPGSRVGPSHGWRRPASPERQDLSLEGVSTQFSRSEYCAAVEHCREAIVSGRVFEVCLTQQMVMDLPGDPWDLYQTLRTINPAPFSSFLRFADFAVVSASPERFLSLAPHGVVESRPIKGTASRGRTLAEDERLRDALLASAKDRAENVMIVDLVRNDLGKVCETGSVIVPELCVIESYPTVHQLVSTVRGQLAADHDALDLVRACFPGGSMTGAPKIEAMKLINEVEHTTRGVYSGALGYLDRRGTMDLAIVIRTIVCEQGKARLGTGGAITADSDPETEYAETLAKAKALITAVRMRQAAQATDQGPTGTPS